jgi:hypothetical protein
VGQPKAYCEEKGQTSLGVIGVWGMRDCVLFVAVVT